MKTRKRLSFLLIALAVLCLTSCQDWGKWDDPAGGQKNPPAPDTSVKLLASYTFEEEIIDPATTQLFAYDSGSIPLIIEDADRGKVLQQKGGYTRFVNPLTDATLTTGASISLWVKTSSNETGTLFSFIDDAGSILMLNADGTLSYDGAGGWFKVGTEAKAIADGDWHFVVLSVLAESYALYIDGTKYDKDNHGSYGSGTRASFSFTNVANLIKSAPYIYIGYSTETAPKELYIDDLKFYQNILSDKETVPEGGQTVLPTPVYFNSFDKDNNATIVGGGSFGRVTDPGFGVVFKNITGGLRKNYLLLPDHVLSHSFESKELSIGVWVNAANAGAPADYMWAPLFMAYGAAPAAGGNTWPMLGCQYRGLLQINCAGWSDFTDAQNVKGANTLYHGDTDWLADKKWHYYTVTFTAHTAKVYIDGELKNEWAIEEGLAGLFSNGADLKYICLGGNQAWNWGDNDPGFMFDDIAIYNAELSKKEIKAIIDAKVVKLPTPVYQNTFEGGLLDTQIVGSGKLVKVANESYNQVFQNAVGGKRQNYLLLPNHVMSHSVDSKALSIAVWVNGSTAGEPSSYMWAPLFMAYGAAPAAGGNTWPMFACQYRGLLQINCAGWCDFSDAQNVKGANTLYHGDTDWLADKKWHFYTATLTPTSSKVYVDGVLKNEWRTEDGVAGLFSNGADLKYVCLGGNQAWDWGDNDPGFMFDDIAIYNIELSESDIHAIMSNK